MKGDYDEMKTIPETGTDRLEGLAVHNIFHTEFGLGEPPYYWVDGPLIYSTGKGAKLSAHEFAAGFLGMEWGVPSGSPEIVRAVDVYRVNARQQVGERIR